MMTPRSPSLDRLQPGRARSANRRIMLKVPIRLTSITLRKLSSGCAPFLADRPCADQDAGAVDQDAGRSDRPPRPWPQPLRRSSALLTSQLSAIPPIEPRDALRALQPYIEHGDAPFAQRPRRRLAKAEPGR